MVEHRIALISFRSYNGTEVQTQLFSIIPTFLCMYYIYYIHLHSLHSTLRKLNHLSSANEILWSEDTFIKIKCLFKL